MSQTFHPHRVVSLQPSASVVLCGLGLAERIVACTRYCADVCPELRNGEGAGPVIVSDSWTAQCREILDAHPDLVIAAIPYQLEAVAEILKAGIRFLGLAPRTLQDIYVDIASIAGVMGEAGRGSQLVQEMRDAIAAVREEVKKSLSESDSSASSKPLVYCEEWGKPLIASQLWVAELIEVAGGRFLGEPGKTTTAEAVAAANPDMILAAWCGAGDRVPLEKIIAQRGWGTTQAALSGQVYCIADELLNTPAPTLVGGLRAIAHALHPKIFVLPPGIRRIHML